MYVMMDTADLPLVFCVCELTWKLSYDVKGKFGEELRIAPGCSMSMWSCFTVCASASRPALIVVV